MHLSLTHVLGQCHVDDQGRGRAESDVGGFMTLSTLPDFMMKYRNKSSGLSFAYIGCRTSFLNLSHFSSTVIHYLIISIIFFQIRIKFLLVMALNGDQFALFFDLDLVPGFVLFLP